MKLMSDIEESDQGTSLISQRLNTNPEQNRLIQQKITTDLPQSSAKKYKTEANTTPPWKPQTFDKAQDFKQFIGWLQTIS